MCTITNHVNHAYQRENASCTLPNTCKNKVHDVQHAQMEEGPWPPISALSLLKRNLKPITLTWM